MISYLGWNFNIHQGQFEADPDLVAEYVKFRIEDHELYDAKADSCRINAGLPPDPHWNDWKPGHPSDACRSHNLLSRLPIFNIIYGVGKIIVAVNFQSRDYLYVKKEDEIWARLLLFTVGILEITWIGGLLAHGIASIYFHFTKTEEIVAPQA